MRIVNNYMRCTDFRNHTNEASHVSEEAKASAREAKKRLRQSSIAANSYTPAGEDAKTGYVKKEYTGTSKTTVLGSMQQYTQRITENRKASKETSTELKKTLYNFKSIASKIAQSKTSASAKRVISQARREVMRLQKQRQSEGYNNEELEAAIVHAKAMERLAKKKARHLEEEELKKAGTLCVDAMDDKKKYSADEDPLAFKKEWDEEAKDIQETEDIQRAEGNQEIEDIQEDIISESSEEMQQLMEEMSEELKSFLEDMGLEELSESSDSAVSEDMDPADFKMMKLKHRLSEDKDQVKADSEYLKAMFKIFSQQSPTASYAAFSQQQPVSINVAL